MDFLERGGKMCVDLRKCEIYGNETEAFWASMAVLVEEETFAEDEYESVNKAKLSFDFEIKNGIF